MENNRAEINDLVTCSFCLYRFDSVERKPKFLPCADTLCLHCLRVIQFNGAVICPTCGKVWETLDVGSLPNNLYALCILDMRAKKKDAKTKMGPSWCLDCASVSEAGCYGQHSTVHMKANTITSDKPFHDLKQDLMTMKDAKQKKMAQTVANRKKVKTHLHQILNALKSVIARVKEAEEENNMALAEIVSLMDGGFSTTGEEKIENSLSSLFSLVENSKWDNSLKELEEKMKGSLKISEEKLKQANIQSLEIEHQAQTKIRVILSGGPVETGLFNPKCVAWLDSGFKVEDHRNKKYESHVNKNLLLLSSTIFSMLSDTNPRATA